VVLDEEGKKLSKRLRNYPSPEEMFETYGADALRWFLVASPVLRGSDLQIDREGQAIRGVVRLVLKPIWNAYYFFCLYANAEDIEAHFSTESEQVLDRYILAKTRDAVAGVGEDLDAYDIPGACARITSFIDALNNWYIRRSRPRFWSQEKSPDKVDAYNTLYTVMHVLLRVASPLLPMLSEEIFRGLTGEESVHLCDWPDAEELPSDAPLVASMDRVRDICSAALALRRTNDVRVRQPLRTLTVAGTDAENLSPLVDLIRDEVNVKEVVLSGELDRYASFRLQVNARTLGKRLGKKMQEVIRSSKAGEWDRLDDGRVEVAGETLDPEDFSILLDAKEDVACQALGSNDAIVMLDLELDEELQQEGQARDIVRIVQQARRDSDLHVADRIHLVLDVPQDWQQATKSFGDYIAEQTLALRLDVSAAAADPSFARHEASVSGQPIRVSLKVVS
jgi:isoleucyl-tRNA synthetase